MSKTERIVEAAANRFRYYGVAKTTMQEIAQDAGVAVGTLYLYFKNKDDLIVACLTEFVERHRGECEAIVTADLPADEKLRRYVVGRFRAAEEIRTGSRHAAELTRAVLRLRPDRAQEEGMMIWDTAAKILRQGVEARLFQIDSVEDDAKAFLYAIAIFFPNALAEPTIPPKEEDLQWVIAWFVNNWKRGRGKPKTARAAKTGRVKA